MNLSLLILLGIGGLWTALSSLWVFAMWKTGRPQNFLIFENRETVPNGLVASSLKETATKK